MMMECDEVVAETEDFETVADLAKRRMTMKHRRTHNEQNI
jgi:hypothetical protein